MYIKAYEINKGSFNNYFHLKMMKAHKMWWKCITFILCDMILYNIEIAHSSKFRKPLVMVCFHDSASFIGSLYWRDLFTQISVTSSTIPCN
jgi:hypothetical protein